MKSDPRTIQDNYRPTETRTNRRTLIRTDSHKKRPTEGRTETQTNSHTKRPREGRTETHTDSYTKIHTDVQTHRRPVT